MPCPESHRLAADQERSAHWKRWGCHLPLRQWGTVREDYSPDGDCWNALTHDQARSRAYRWGEDGLLGICDRQCRLCLAPVIWNGRDPILKERLFGLTNPEGNHGEDAKEIWTYLEATPTSSSLRALYKYPLTEYPYAQLVEENRRRGPADREFELLDTGVMEQGHVDLVVDYAKAAPEDIVARFTVVNHGSTTASIHLIPQLWFRNTWAWGGEGEDHLGEARPLLRALDDGRILAEHVSLGTFLLEVLPGPEGERPELLFTENETNTSRLFGTPSQHAYVKDAFHERIVHGRIEAVNPSRRGTKAGAWHRLEIEPGASRSVHVRLRRLDEPARRDREVATPTAISDPAELDALIELRRREADAFLSARLDEGMTPEERRVAREAWAGLLWSRQFYHYSVREWLSGDRSQPPPPASRGVGRNAEWGHLYNRDVILVPDPWEYPWYAAWDLAFHAVAIAPLDPQFAKDQLLLLLREWYMHPNGQIPAYEFALGDVNPPVHAWACWRVYKQTGRRGERDRVFLARAFQKLLINFTWWVNRKDTEGRHVFGGGFLGLDNIGVFDRSRPLPTGGRLEQADGTAWMAFYCLTMLAMALELATEDPAYEDVATKFLEHFTAIADAMNTLGGTGLWDDEDGFYYDQLHLDGPGAGSGAAHHHVPLKVRSMVGLLPLIAVEVLEDDVIDRLPAFRRRLEWFLAHRRDLGRHVSYLVREQDGGRHGHRLLALPSRERLERMLHRLVDEGEFLSPHGVRSLSRVHLERPYRFDAAGQEFIVRYEPAESTTGIFGGNSNWRGPVWFPVNWLIIEALERWDHFHGAELTVPCPWADGARLTPGQIAQELRRRLGSLFLPGADGHRPLHGGDARFRDDPRWSDVLLYHEYYCGDTGRGLGASHQTGWTALVAPCLVDLARRRGPGARSTAAPADGTTRSMPRMARGGAASSTRDPSDSPSGQRRHRESSPSLAGPDPRH